LKEVIMQAASVPFAPSSGYLPTSKPTPATLGVLVDLLTHEGEWKGVLAWDSFAQRLVFRRRPPIEAPGEELAGKTVASGDFDRIRLWVEEVAGMVAAKGTLMDAVRLVAARDAFHPVREYLESLTWDGVPRVDTWLETFCAVAPTSQGHKRLIRAVARKWLVACVARAMQPGCKVDTMLVLEGKQGIGKSSALAALAGEAYFCDALIDFGTKDACQTIQGVWIYELAELDAIVRGGTSQAKGFITRAVDRFRKPYGRAAESVPRSVVFCGTVNHGGYLKDSTGNRRFWTVRCGGALDVEGIRRERDQLWAEARTLYDAGEAWHLAAADEALMGDEQAERVEVDPWEEILAAWTRRRGDAPFGMNELLEGALGLTAQSRNPRVTKRVTPMLVALGYERLRVCGGGERTYVYARAGRGGDPLRTVLPLLPGR
jgi:predicted P-loop ATPase